nr:unnamed protein product [Digitaria exilis]
MPQERGGGAGAAPTGARGVDSPQIWGAGGSGEGKAAGAGEDAARGVGEERASERGGEPRALWPWPCYFYCGDGWERREGKEGKQSTTRQPWRGSGRGGYLAVSGLRSCSGSGLTSARAAGVALGAPRHQTAAAPRLFPLPFAPHPHHSPPADAANISHLIRF